MVKSTSCSNPNSVHAAILIWLLRGRLGGLDDRRLLMTPAKVTRAGCVMAVVAVAIQHALDRAVPGQHLAIRAVRLGGSIGGAMAALAAAAKIFGVEEFDGASEMLLGRVRKSARKVTRRAGRSGAVRI